MNPNFIIITCAPGGSGPGHAIYVTEAYTVRGTCSLLVNEFYRQPGDAALFGNDRVVVFDHGTVWSNAWENFERSMCENDFGFEFHRPITFTVRSVTVVAGPWAAGCISRNTFLNHDIRNNAGGPYMGDAVAPARPRELKLS